MMDESIMSNTRRDILIVDDVPENLQILALMLKDQGYSVRPVSSGRMALKTAKANPPDLILLDITMPDMNGYEVCEIMKQDPVLKDIPVIFISALADTGDKLKAFDTGGVDYITKPFKIQEIQARVATHLKLRQMQKALEHYSRNLEAMVQAQVQQISAAQMATIFALAKLAESRDDETGRHLERVQKMCRLLTTQLKQELPPDAEVITESFIEMLYHASPLHDIGKVGISDLILLKPGKLTEAEFKIIKTHPVIGAETLAAVYREHPNEMLKIGIEIARYHHERWDGAGYPEGLTAEQIPLSARIMALVDAYDAICSKRVYKEAMSHEAACEIIRQDSGKHFDPQVVAAFLKAEPQISLLRQQLQD